MYRYISNKELTYLEYLVNIGYVWCVYNLAAREEKRECS